MQKYQVIFARHGESEWTNNNLFCGWYNAQLTEKGINDGIEIGRTLKKMGIVFDIAFTSQLSRAKNTLDLILKELSLNSIEITSTWKLNERHYGDLTGMNKMEAAEKYGKEQVQIWRRSFDIFPPPMTESHKYYNDIKNFVESINKSESVNIPAVETLKTTMERVVPYWLEEIVPKVKSGKRVLVISHGTSLRGLVKYFDNVSDKDIMGINIPTAIPFFYEFDKDMNVIKSMQYIAEKEAVERGIKKAASINYKEEN